MGVPVQMLNVKNIISKDPTMWQELPAPLNPGRWGWGQIFAFNNWWSKAGAGVRSSHSTIGGVDGEQTLRSRKRFVAEHSGSTGRSTASATTLPPDSAHDDPAGKR